MQQRYCCRSWRLCGRPTPFHCHNKLWHLQARDHCPRLANLSHFRLLSLCWFVFSLLPLHDYLTTYCLSRPSRFLALPRVFHPLNQKQPSAIPPSCTVHVASPMHQLAPILFEIQAPTCPPFHTYRHSHPSCHNPPTPFDRLALTPLLWTPAGPSFCAAPRPNLLSLLGHCFHALNDALPARLLCKL